ncbi:hypothetical protein V5O48_010046 [Marasmius crinis-equi]|uniref:Uncharacterized protein n=1 Tax=Marasmius crinis-equi TaxID=585013 RepID=A0ABR3F9H2_9AGAR
MKPSTLSLPTRDVISNQRSRTPTTRPRQFPSDSDTRKTLSRALDNDLESWRKLSLKTGAVLSPPPFLHRQARFHDDPRHDSAQEVKSLTTRTVAYGRPHISRPLPLVKKGTGKETEKEKGKEKGKERGKRKVMEDEIDAKAFRESVLKLNDYDRKKCGGASRQFENG